MNKTRNITLLFFLAVIVLASVQLMLFNSNQNYLQSMEHHQKQDERRQKLNEIFKLILDIETGARGYILTGNVDFLEPRDIAEKLIDGELAQLSKMLEYASFNRLSSLIHYRIAHADKLIEKKQKGEAVSVEDLKIGQDIMEQIRLEIEQFERKDHLLDSRLHEMLQDKSEFTTILIITGTTLSLTIVVFSALAALSEIRKRSEAESSLALALATSEAISNNVGMGVLATDKAGKVIFANHRALSMTGFRLQEIIQLSVNTILKNFSVSPAVLSSLMIPDITLTQNFELREGAEVKTIKLTASPLFINGMLEGKIISLSDISEEAANIKELDFSKKLAEKASHAKSDFLAKMSHEIRTPLNAILGVGEILQSTKLTTEQQKCMEIFEQSSQTLNNLVTDILDLSKIEAGKLEIINDDFSLSHLLNSCSSLLEFRASQKGLLFEIINEATTDHFVGDEGRLRQVLLNLVGNAIKFTDRGSVTLKVDCKPFGNDQRRLLFQVIDTGRGILPENIDKLFKNYHQETSRISSEFGGTGLGLALSKELAHLMNGDIVAESVHGKGSIFTFTCVLNSSVKPFQKMETDESVNLQGYRVMLVDDNPENRFIVSRYLKDTGVEITEADDGLRAFDYFRKDKYDLIFMDLNMPVMDGTEATRKIRAWETHKNLPRTTIVALSANAMSQDYKRAFEAGCDDYLTKPLPRMKLLSLLKKWKDLKVSPSAENDNSSEPEEIDEEILAMVPHYLDKRRADVLLISEAINNQDLTVLNRIGHNIKGTAKSYGQYELEKIATRFYQAVKDENWEMIKSTRDEMARLLQS